MRKHWAFWLLTICCVLFVPCIARTQPTTLIAHYKMNENTASDNDEVITNGDFESGFTGGLGDGWTLPRGNASDETVDFHGGAHAQELTNPAGDTGIITQQKALVSGRTYRLSFWAKKSKGTGGFVEDSFPGLYFGPITIDEATFTEHVIFFVAAAGLDILVGFCANTNASDDTNGILFDDVSIKLCAVEDSSGNDHDGLLQEDTDAAHVTGKNNGAFDFDGSGDYIEIADHDDFSPGDGTAGSGTPFSISSWVNMDTAAYFIPASKWQAGSNQEWLLFTGTQKTIHFRMYDDSASAYIGRAYSTSLASYEGKWTHFVATYDGGTLSSGIKIYLNGNRVDDAPSESSPGSFVAVENLDQAVWIGRYSEKHSNGLFDNVAFFSRELDQFDVDFLYNTGGGTERWGEKFGTMRTIRTIRTENL